MKQTIKFLAAAFAIVAAASCQKEVVVETGLKTVTLSAELAGTKAAVQNDGKVFWEEGDEIAVWAGGQKSTFTLVSGAGSTVATFTGTIADGAEVTSAVSPASLAGTAEGAFTVPTTQTVEAGEMVDPAALVMTATCTGTTLSFTNPCGIVTLTVPAAGVTGATLKSGDKMVKLVLPGTDGTFGVVLPADEYPAIAASISGSFMGTSGTLFKSSENTLKVEAGKIVSLGNLANLSPDALVANPIMTAEQLVAWAQHADMYSAGETVNIGADIDLSVLNNGQNYKWTPVSFAGNLVGTNEAKPFVIKGYEIKASDQTYKADDYMYLGFLGYLSGGLENLQFGTPGGNDAVVIADDNATAGTSYHLNVGGVIGRCKYGWIKNVISYADASYTATTSKYKFRIGGICGHFQSAPSSDVQYAVYNCKFGGNAVVSGVLPANTAYVGGIIGYSQANIRIRNCTNVGYVKELKGQNYQIQLGGIIGQLGSDSSGNSAVISNCKNGEVVNPDAEPLIQLTLGGCYDASKTSYKYLGGIAGAIYAKMDHCFNYANLKVFDAANNADQSWEGGAAKGKSSPRMGGVSGYLTTKGTALITNCANFGNVYNGYANDSRCNQANIIGYAQAFTADAVKNCLCAGNITTKGGAWARTGIIVGVQAATGLYGTEAAPVYILKGITLTNTAGTVTIDETNASTYYQGTGSGAGNTYKVAMVSTLEEGLSKLVDTYAE